MSEYTFSSPEEQEAHFELTHDTNMRKIEAECKPRPQSPEAPEGSTIPACPDTRLYRAFPESTLYTDDKFKVHDSEAPEDWEKDIGVLLRGMTFPDQIVSHVKALLKAEREKVLGEIEGVMVIDGESAWEFESRVIAKIAEIRGE